MSPIEKAQFIAEVISSEDVSVFKELANWGDHDVAAVGNHLMASHRPRSASVILTASDFINREDRALSCMASSRGAAKNFDIALAIYSMSSGMVRMASQAMGGDMERAISIALLAIMDIEKEAHQ